MLQEQRMGPSPYRVPTRSPGDEPPRTGSVDVPPGVVVFVLLLLTAIILYFREPADAHDRLFDGPVIHLTAHPHHR